jgi:hypothetical protein
MERILPLLAGRVLVGLWGKETKGLVLHGVELFEAEPHEAVDVS